MQKKRSALLVTVLIVAAIVVVLNWLVASAGFLNVRVDLTQQKLYTLSSGTKRILANIKADDPVTIRFYATGDSRIMPAELGRYATSVQDLLLDMEKAADGKLALQRIDPRPDTDTEDKAVADDIAGQQVDMIGNKFYFGMAVECGDRKEIIPVLSPANETSLEYDIARAIAKVSNAKKTGVGVMSAMPISGSPMNFMMRQGPPPWEVIKELRADYDVREVAVSADKIDSDISVLVLIHPADIRATTEFAIDQFLLRGGKIVAFVDSKSLVSNIYNNQQQNPMMGMAPPSVPPFSTLKNLFKAWGVGFDDMVVADMTDATQQVPVYLTIGTADQGINTSVPVTAQLQEILMLAPGAFNIEKKEGIKTVTLLQSSENSMMIDGTTADKIQRAPFDAFRSEGHKRILGVQLTGHFKTAFPNGAPKEEPRPDSSNTPGGLPGFLPPGAMPPNHGTGGSEADAGAPEKDGKKGAPPAPAPAAATPATATAAPKAPEPKVDAAPKGDAKPATPPTTVKPDTSPSAPPVAAAPAAPATPVKPVDNKPAGPPPLKESTNDEGAIYLFSDADMLYDQVAFQRDQLGRMAPRNHNDALLFNAVETLSGGADLISVRSRGAVRRPFTKFQQMSEALVAKYRPKIEQLVKKRDEAGQEMQKIKTLEVTIDPKTGQPDIADPVKKAKIKELTDTQMNLSKELRETRKQENRDRDYLETWITVLNLLVVPALVIIFGITLAVRRHSLQAAK